ncbi:BnaC06g10810D [Brassica napus]|uniref:BnaC06g10810D protein n=1 Tax=Brassica napus TaxID=3708 RepID=A0A078GI42_BRANA|nr:BnaC06g10810D [Brassica napus]
MFDDGDLCKLQLVLGRCKNWSLEKRIMVGRLCILHIAIFGIAPTRRIPLECAKRVLDFEAFERYPWGRVASGSRKRYVSDDFIRQEKIEHEDKVRVRHFFSHVDENLVPKWDGELEDENVNHLIRDILDDCVNRKAWDLVETSVTKRTKRKESIPMNVSEDSANKDKKAKPMEDGRYNADGNDTPSTAMLTMLKTLTEKVDNMNTNMATKLMAGLDAAIGTKVDVIIGPLIEKVAFKLLFGLN